MNNWKLKVGCWKEYETPVGVHGTNKASLIAHNDRRYVYEKYLEYFDEKTFSSKEDLERFIDNVYPDKDDYVFTIERKNILGDWCSDSWFSDYDNLLKRLKNASV